MHDELFEVSGREFQLAVERLFEQHRGGRSFEIPIIGGHCGPSDAERRAALLTVCRALVARERFHEEAGCAAQLPLNEGDCHGYLKNSFCNRNLAIAWYAQSQRWSNWAATHPGFRRFGSGLTANLFTPQYWDEQMKFEFPPHDLPELTVAPWPPHWVHAAA